MRPRTASARGGQAVCDFQPQRCVESLIVGRVEFYLVHIHPNERTLSMGRRSNPAVFRKCGCCDHRGSPTERRTPGELLARCSDLDGHGVPPASADATAPDRVEDSSFCCPRNAQWFSSDRRGRTRMTAFVRSAPKADKRVNGSVRQLCAMCGRLRVGKGFLHVCRLVGAAMCSAC